MDIDISVYPVFKEQALNMIKELDAVWENPQFSEAAKATRFHMIMTKYDMIA